MMLDRLFRSVWAIAPSVLLFAGSAEAQRQGQPTVQDMLALRPTQKFVDYDTPTTEQSATLRADLVTEGKAKIWVLRDPAGRIYRRFVDSDRDGVVDQWIYYRDGAEAYRDIDSNSNRLADQFRWVNSGGTRWAIDSNEDGKIDAYRLISPAEATREVVRAVVAKDPSLVEAVLARSSDAASLNRAITADRLKDLNKWRDQFAALSSQADHWTNDTEWVRIESQVPMLIPGEAPDGSRDVELFRNVQAVVQTGNRVDLLQFGDIAVVGRVAKILAMPTFSTPKSPVLAQTQTVFNNVPESRPEETEPADKQQQTLMVQLQKLDEESAKIGQSEITSVRYQLQRASILEKLAEHAKSDQDRLDWLRQQADCLIAAIQVSGDKEPRERLSEFYESMRNDEKTESLASYVAFRQISAEYFRSVQQAGSDFAAVQKEWLENLEQFVAEYPESDDTPEALSQLAIGYEFTGKEDSAKESYQKIVDHFPKSAPAARARGAVDRLNLIGKPFKLRASEIRRGTVDVEKLSKKVVLVDYWATTCEPWKAELPRLKEIYNKYHSKGFEIVGVSLDTDKAALAKYVQSAGISWPVVFEPGGHESPLALQYGILALPTQFLVDADGKVVSRTIHITQLEEELKKLLDK